MAIVKIVNAQDGSDARYDVSLMTPEEAANFAPDGKPLGANSAPDQWTWTDGIPGAREGNAEHGGALGPGGSPYGSGSPDAYYNQLRTMLAAQSTADQGNTRSAIQKALIGYGLVPEGFEDSMGALDDVTKSLIAKNTDSGISYYARLLEQRKDSMKSLVGRLTSSGLARSGTKGAKMRKGQLDFDRLFQDSLSELLGQVGTLKSGYANNEQQRQMQLLSALQNSRGNYTSSSGNSVAQPVVNAAAPANPYGYSGGTGEFTNPAAAGAWVPTPQQNYSGGIGGKRFVF